MSAAAACAAGRQKTLKMMAARNTFDIWKKCPEAGVGDTVRQGKCLIFIVEISPRTP
jgi:hypothetical protein